MRSRHPRQLRRPPPRHPPPALPATLGESPRNHPRSIFLCAAFRSSQFRISLHTSLQHSSMPSWKILIRARNFHPLSSQLQLPCQPSSSPFLLSPSQFPCLHSIQSLHPRFTSHF